MDPRPRPPRGARAALVLVPLVLTACGGGGGGGGSQSPGGLTVPEDTFTARLDEAQTVPAARRGTRLAVTATNRAPAGGTLLAPVWVGFHDGAFELADDGAAAATHFPAQNALERLAEDGDPAPLVAAFAASHPCGAQRVLEGRLGEPGGALAPGETVSATVELDPADACTRYLSVAAMVAPSNDALVVTVDPTAHPVFTGGGALAAQGFTLAGAAVRDAGTEVNDEQPRTTAWLGQTGPDVGVPEGGVVAPHPGFAPAGSGGVLDDPRFAQGDFTAPGYEVLAVGLALLPPRPAARGLATVRLEDDGQRVAFTVSAAHLSGPALGVRLGAGAPGVAGATLLDLSGAMVTNAHGTLWVEGEAPATDALRTALRAGEVHVAVPTLLNPDGELRGQVTVEPAWLGPLDTAQPVSPPIAGEPVRVVVRNPAPAQGTWLSPVWVGFHDGTFDYFDVDILAKERFPESRPLERFAEDDDFGPLSAELGARGGGPTQGTIAGVLRPGPLAPGETAARVLRVDPTDPRDRWLSFATGLRPSNDGFLGNDDPAALRIFDDAGAFLGATLVLRGTDALDAGTEVNDELPEHTAFFGQTTPDSGLTAEHVVYLHDGYLLPGAGGVLDHPDFAAADFTAPGYELLRLRVEAVDETAPPPAATGIAALTLVGQGTGRLVVAARDLTGPALGVSLHVGAPGTKGPAIADVTDAVVLDADGVLFVDGSVPTGGLGPALNAGRVYVNVRTALNPEGELRARLRIAE